MATLTINISQPASAYKVGYRPLGSGAPYTYLSTNPTASPVIIPGVAAGDYQVEVSSVCTDGNASPPVTAMALANPVICESYYWNIHVDSAELVGTSDGQLHYTWKGSDGIMREGSLGSGGDYIHEVCNLDPFVVGLEVMIGGAPQAPTACYATKTANTCCNAL